MIETLSERALNRAYLARQLLLERAELPLPDAIEHLVGLQAQSPSPPYLALWSRLAAFDPHELGTQIADGRAARIVVMRGTIHLLTARDCLPLRRLTQPVLDRGFKSNARYRAGVEGLDTQALADEASRILSAEPMVMRDLGLKLQGRWPERDPESMGYAARCLLPLVQLPPRGVWGRAGQPVLALAEAWLAHAENRPVTLEDLVRRYLAAFGPASIADMQAWSGLTRLKEVFERLRPGLCTFRVDTGPELFDLPDAPRPGPDVEAPARFLPEFDNATLSHADRSRIVDDASRRRIATRNGMVPGTFLVDGCVAGTWTVRGTRDATTLRIEEYRSLSMPERQAVEEEGRRLIAFREGAPARIDVEFRTPG